MKTDWDKETLERVNISMEEILLRRDLSLEEKGLLSCIVCYAFDDKTLADVLDESTSDSPEYRMEFFTSLIKKNYLEMRWKEGYCFIYLPQIDFGMRIMNLPKSE